MQIVIHKIGGLQELPRQEMDSLWDFGDTLPPEISKLIDDKLRQTASLGNCEALKFFVEKGGNINSQDPYTGNTPLMQAIGVTQHLDKQRQVITYLMEAGADSNIKNVYGLCPKSPTPGMPDNPLVTLCRE